MGCAVSTAIPVDLPAFPEEAQDEEEKRSVEVQIAETGPSAPSPSRNGLEERTTRLAMPKGGTVLARRTWASGLC